jgi:hypothetical protein
MASFNRADYLRLFMLACELHNASTNRRTRAVAADLADMAEGAIGQMYRPDGMREAKDYPPGVKKC